MSPSTTFEPLLALLQLSDSGFPSGGFTHSFGLEQLTRERLVRTPADVERFVGSLLRQSFAPSDAPAAYAAAIACEAHDLSKLVETDRALYRLKAAAELREATVSTGRRLLTETRAFCESELIAKYALALRADATLGTHAVVFGAVCAAMGVPPEDVPAAQMLGAAYAVLQAAIRLLPFSHRDAQGILHKLRPEIAEHTRVIVDGVECHGFGSFHPLQEIASMRHAHAEARLFKS